MFTNQPQVISRNLCRIYIELLNNKQSVALLHWLNTEMEELFEEFMELWFICEDYLHNKLKNKPLNKETHIKKIPQVRWNIKFIHKAMDKIIELYKENEHGTELVKDIEKVLALQTREDKYTPSTRAKEYLKQSLNIIKGI